MNSDYTSFLSERSIEFPIEFQIINFFYNNNIQGIPVLYTTKREDSKIGFSGYKRNLKMFCVFTRPPKISEPESDIILFKIRNFLLEKSKFLEDDLNIPCYIIGPVVNKTELNTSSAPLLILRSTQLSSSDYCIGVFTRYSDFEPGKEVYTTCRNHIPSITIKEIYNHMNDMPSMTWTTALQKMQYFNRSCKSFNHNFFSNFTQKPIYFILNEC